uniref:Spliceosomal U5 snRNP-specific 15 kDa protein, putative n=1 Tax=Musa acuminata TaxID=4641 RepID=Q1EP80_MUSAC|nr:spliceosomal U5 snRNP-specific 15 kDa protein, putative [Musa acuminata]
MTDFGLSKGIIVSLLACRYLCSARGGGGRRGVEWRREEDVVLVAASALGVGGGSGDPGRGGAPRRHPVWPRLGRDLHAGLTTTCIFVVQMDEVLASVAETIKNFAVIYLVDITEVPDFNTMYELYDPSTVMFFFRNKHIMIDLGTGNNNKINWALKDKQEFIDIVETVYRGARKGRGLVIAPKDYSTKYRY